MRLALRSSGGRGEYELAGTHSLFPSNGLFDKEIIIELSPGVRISTKNFVTRQGGKRRVRLADESTDYHIYQILAALLLLPKPIRAKGETGDGHVQIIDDHFSFADIWFDFVRVTDSELVIRPTSVKLANNESSRTLDVAQRMNLVVGLWNRAEDEPDSAAKTRVMAHLASYHSGGPASLIQTTALIRHNLTQEEDPLRNLYRVHQLSDGSTTDMGITTTPFVEPPERDTRSIIQSAQEIARVWRHLKYRGAEGERFRRAVTREYGFTCLFSGNCLPSTPLTGTPGVDAAHILPWATHNINDVQNGICLDKLCHWAFDAGVLRLDFDAGTNDYLLSVPAAIKRQPSLMDLTPFLALEGPIPQNRLPYDRNKWPNPAFINQYNLLFT
jgi:hypothetical protein